MAREGSMAVLAAAKRAGMSPGDYVSGLVAGAPVLFDGGSRTARITELTTSNSHMSELSRNVRALTRLLSQANVEQARVYRAMLDMLNKDIHGHLVLSSRALAELRLCRSLTRTGR
jgi:hypothetical protein